MRTALLKWMARCPLWLLHALGVLLGWLAYLLDTSYRQRLAENLRLLAANDYNHLLHKSIAHHGKGALELFAAWGRPADYVCGLVRECHGWQHAEQALAEKRALIFVSPHLGCFDIAGRYVSQQLPYPMTAMYRPPKQAWLEPLMQMGRARDNARTAPATPAGVRLLLKALKSGEATFVLPDQAPGAGEGVWASFFGKPAYTMTLLPRLALSANAVVLFCFAERLSWGRGYRMHLLPMQGAFSGDKQADAETLNRNVEALIQLAPAQYLWSYNRFKSPTGAPPIDEAAA